MPGSQTYVERQVTAAASRQDVDAVDANGPRLGPDDFAPPRPAVQGHAVLLDGRVGGRRLHDVADEGERRAARRSSSADSSGTGYVADDLAVGVVGVGDDAQADLRRDRSWTTPSGTRRHASPGPRRPAARRSRGGPACPAWPTRLILQDAAHPRDHIVRGPARRFVDVKDAVQRFITFTSRGHVQPLPVTSGNTRSSTSIQRAGQGAARGLRMTATAQAECHLRNIVAGPRAEVHLDRHRRLFVEHGRPRALPAL